MTDTPPPVPSASPTPSGDDPDAWPASGPARGLRVRLPIAIAALVVVGLVGAAGGAAMKKSSSSATQSGAIAIGRARFGANGAPGANGATGANGAAGANAPGGGGVFGTVSKLEGNTVTITQRDGSTATVVVPSGTTITKTVNGSLSDLTSGTSVVVRGTTAGGKTTAQDITIAPAGGTGFPGGFGGFGGRRGTGTGGTGTGSGTGSGSGGTTN